MMQIAQTELHRHLDASLRTSTLLELLQKKGLEPHSTSLASFNKKFILRSPLKDLRSVLEKFKLFQLVLDSPEALERVAFEAIEDCQLEGTQQVELRFSPSFVSEESHLSWVDILTGFSMGVEKALKKFPEMKAGFICIATRDYGIDSVEETIDFYIKNKDKFIGVDLAGNEKKFPCRLFESAFRKVRAAELPITIHAGEDTGAQNIWEALELLGAHRIGHGIGLIEDPLLMRHLEQNGICLEMCPTSNWITRCTRDLKQHPIGVAVRAGIKVCINTDDPGIFGITMPYELNLCRTQIGLTQKEIELCLSHAALSSFI